MDSKWMAAALLLDALKAADQAADELAGGPDPEAARLVDEGLVALRQARARLLGGPRRLNQEATAARW